MGDFQFVVGGDFTVVLALVLARDVADHQRLAVDGDAVVITFLKVFASRLNSFCNCACQDGQGELGTGNLELEIERTYHNLAVEGDEIRVVRPDEDDAVGRLVDLAREPDRVPQFHLEAPRRRRQVRVDVALLLVLHVVVCVVCCVKFIRVEHTSH